MAGSTYVPVLGANLTDASVTKNPASDGVSEYQLPAATLSASRTLTLGTSGSPVTNDVIRIVRLDLTANTYLVSDGSSTLFTFPVSPTGPTGASFYFNGTAWKFLSAYALDVLSQGIITVTVMSATTDVVVPVPDSDLTGGYLIDFASPGASPQVSLRPMGDAANATANSLQSYAGSASASVDAVLMISNGVGAGGHCSSSARFFCPVGMYKFFSMAFSDSNNPAGLWKAGHYKVTTAITSLTFHALSGTIPAGTIIVITPLKLI